MDRNLACKTCGTKTFKISSELEDHHKEAHPDVQRSEDGSSLSDQEGNQQTN